MFTVFGWVRAARRGCGKELCEGLLLEKTTQTEDRKNSLFLEIFAFYTIFFIFRVDPHLRVITDIFRHFLSVILSILLFYSVFALHEM